MLDDPYGGVNPSVCYTTVCTNTYHALFKRVKA